MGAIPKQQQASSDTVTSLVFIKAYFIFLFTSTLFFIRAFNSPSYSDDSKELNVSRSLKTERLLGEHLVKRPLPMGAIQTQPE